MSTIPYYKNPIDKIDTAYMAQAIGDESKKLIDDFEQNFCKYVGIDHAISTINASTAMHLALCAIDIKRGDKIICSINAHPSIPSIIRQFDAEPIFVDIEEDTFNIDLEKLQETLKEKKAKKLRGIIISYIAGQMPDLDKFYQIVRKNKIFVIEDCTDSLGATYKKQRIGSFTADISIFSFMPYRNNIPAQGAMMTTNDDELYDRAVLMKNHAIKKDEHTVLSYVHDVVDIGCDYNMSGIDAAYCRTVFDNLEKDIKRRKEIAERYNKELAALPHVTIPAITGDHSYFAYMIKIDKNRDDFAKELLKKNIETDVHYMPIHMTKYYREKYELKIMDFPIALRTYGTILSLPVYPQLSNAEVDTVINAVKAIAQSRKW